MIYMPNMHGVKHNSSYTQFYPSKALYELLPPLEPSEPHHIILKLYLHSVSKFLECSDGLLKASSIT